MDLIALSVPQEEALILQEKLKEMQNSFKNTVDK
jgi:hypothetical protein